MTTEITEVTNEIGQNATQEVNRVKEFFLGNVDGFVAFAWKVLICLILFWVGTKIIKFICKIVKKALDRSNVDVGAEQFIGSMTKAALYALLVFMIAVKLGIDASSVAALIASGGVAIGLALQGSLSNFAGGVLILLLKPFVVGDYIVEHGHGNEGTVKEIKTFYTKLSTIDNKIIVIPNGTLANSSLTNVTAKEMRRLDLKIDISYDSDLKKAKQLIQGILENEEGTIKSEEILVYVDELGANSVVIGARAWVKTDEYWPIRWRMLEEIKLTMDKNGISIPVPTDAGAYGERKIVFEIY